MSDFIPVADRFIATTRSGTRYEFEITDKGNDHSGPSGRVRKGEDEWTECVILTPIELGYPMHMVLGRDHNSPIRHTTSVTTINEIEGARA